MQMAGINLDNVVNCRIGSLEMWCLMGNHKKHVNCRIGSLEKQMYAIDVSFSVNCRIGSLES